MLVYMYDESDFQHVLMALTVQDALLFANARMVRCVRPWMAAVAVNRDGPVLSVIPVGNLVAVLTVRFQCLILLECPEGTYGSYCLMNCTCLNGATCGKRQGKCLCAPGFTGTHCETPLPTTGVPTTALPTTVEPTCPSQHCQHGGTCTITLGSPLCA